MRLLPPSHSKSAFTFYSNTKRKTRRSLRTWLFIAAIALPAVAFGANGSSASSLSRLFGKVSNVFGGQPTTTTAKAATVNAILTSEAVEAPTSSTTMTVQRRGHSATRLNDGTVLIAGGENANGVLNETEIYDPASGLFSETGYMNDARADHTATLLSDGRVLIAGGRNATGVVSTTEIFDPSTGTFSSGPNLSVARAGHTATLFADGRILIAGGDGNGSAEIIDASLSGSSATGLMTGARANHSTALLLDGRVLIVGGSDANGNELSSGEIFDNGSFTAVEGALHVARVRAHLRVLFDGKVQIIGGSNDGSMEIYDPSIGAFGAYAHVAPEGDTCASLPAQVQGSQTRAALFHNGQSDPVFDRSSHTMNELGSSAIVIGGSNSANVALSSSPVFNSSSAAISTDKLDYAPGETAHISGRGFQPGETLRVRIHEDPHTPQERGMDVVADGDGNFVAEYLVTEYDLDMKFLVGARGLSSGRTAQTTFTDSQPGTISLTPTSVSVTPGNSAVYGVNITQNGNSNLCTLTLSLTYTGTPPVGTTPSFSPNPLSMTTADVSSMLTIATTNTGPSAGRTQPGTYNFTVGAAKGGNCQGPAGSVTTTGTLVVTNPNVAPVASAVSISGTAEFNQLLTGNYTYSDADGDLQGASTFRWLRNGTTVVGTNQTYTTVSADVAQTLTFEVTPVAQTGISPGAPVTSAGVVIGKAPSTTTINCPASVTYNGAAQTPCTATATGTGGLNASVTVVYGNNTDAGTATADATYAGDTNHNGSVATQVT
ncbi:MAG TPA: kelch repeat-containing protein, partial [Pyrinomonadaceae bacterium]|nr:kelch repeat-containing protein [Pyrinomonadaceae bacterium]